MKPTHAFKLKKEFKRMLANTDNKHVRGAQKKLFIDAQLTSQLQPKKIARAD